MELPKSFLFQNLGILFRNPTCDCFFVGSGKNVSSKMAPQKHRTSPRQFPSPDLEEDKEEARRRVATSVVGRNQRSSAAWKGVTRVNDKNPKIAYH